MVSASTTGISSLNNDVSTKLVVDSLFHRKVSSYKACRNLDMSVGEIFECIPDSIQMKEGDKRHTFTTICGHGTYGIVCKYGLKHALKLIFTSKEDTNDNHQAKYEKLMASILASVCKDIPEELGALLCNVQYLETRSVDASYEMDIYYMPYYGENLYKHIICGSIKGHDEISNTWNSIRRLVYYLSEKGIYCVDLKPSNILLSDAKVPVLCDCGAFSNTR